MGRERATHNTAATPHQSFEIENSYPSIQEDISIRSPSILVDQLFIIASALRCRSLPCTLNKIEKNPDLLTRQTTSMLKSMGYEEDDYGLTKGSLYKILPNDGDGIMKVAQIIRLPDGAKSPWGGVFAPTGSGMDVATDDLINAMSYAEAKVIALTKALYIQVEFLRDNASLKPFLLILHDSIVHYEDAKHMVYENPEFSKELVQVFGIDASSAVLMSQNLMNA